jgi:hypothetical protein
MYLGKLSAKEYGDFEKFCIFADDLIHTIGMWLKANGGDA